MPMFHGFGLSAGVLAPIITNSTVILPSAHFDPKATVDVIIEEKYVPAIFYFQTLFLLLFKSVARGKGY